MKQSCCSPSAGRDEEIEIGPESVRLAALRYELPQSHTARLVGLNGNSVQVEGSRQPPVGSLLRLLTKDGHVYPLPAGAGAEAFRFDAAHRLLTLLRFPQHVHRGDVLVEWRSL